jgi:hypothetical protein
MKNLAIICTLMAGLFITSCGYEGNFRYKCQDPENWELPECLPPICKVSGTCTEDLIGDINE